MKKFLLLFGFLLSVNVLACKCFSPSFGQRFEQSDFIAEVKILNTSNINTNDENYRFYNAEIKILKLYKGKKLKNILIKGKLKDNDLEDFYGGGDCSVLVQKGEKFLIYLTKNDGFKMNSCSYKIGIESSKIVLERKALNFLIKKNIKKTNTYLGDLNLKLFSISISESDFAVYKITTNSKGEAAEIKAVKNFKSSKSDEILNSIKQSLRERKENRKEYYMVLFFRKEEKKSLQEDGFSLWN